MSNIDLSKLITAADKAAMAQAATKAAFQSAIQGYIDQIAQAKSYSDGNSCASYVASTNSQWVSEATAFVAWRDAVWAYSYGELAKVEAGTRTQPTVEEFLTELPTMSWPTN